MSTITVKNKSDQVRDILLQEMKRGKYREGGRVDSDNVLSRTLGISKNTVREAISTLVNDGYLKRIQGKGTFVVSTKPVTQSTGLKIIRLVCRDTYKCGETDHFLNHILRGIHAGGSQYNYGICIDHFTEDSPETLLNSQQFKSAPKDGIILAGFSIDAKEITPLLESNIPVVSIGKPNDESLLPYVDMNHVTAVKKAVEYLFENGHKNIAMLEVDLHAPSHRERIEGYLAAHLEAKVDVNPELIFNAKTTDIDGDTAIKELRNRGVDFTAVITYGDDMLYGALREFRKEHKTVPDDISLVTYSTSTLPVLSFMKLNPTRVQEDMYKLGSEAVKLIHKIDRQAPVPHNTMLEPDFIIGNTVKNIK